MALEQAPQQIDDLSYYHLIRGRLEVEDGLIINRLAWLMASESFLFTAYAVVLNGLAQPASSAGSESRSRLLHLIPAVGIISASLIYVGILAAVRAIAWLKRLCHERIADERSLGLPPLQTPRGTVVAGLAAPLILPVVLVIVWVYLALTAAF